MTIKELLDKINALPNKDRLPRYIEIEDISDSQVLVDGKWGNEVHSWGILFKNNRYIYFETDDERGYLSYIKEFDNEQSACEHAYKIMLMEHQASMENSPLDMAIRFIENKYGYSNDRARKMAEQISKHKSIFEEFLNYVYIGKMRKKDRTHVVVCGYTAEKLSNEYNLSPLGAYNYLVYLAEEPQQALQDLTDGLPTK